jgi:hypothetical protein
MSFQVKEGPSGSVTINSGAKYSTTTTAHTLTFSVNTVAQRYRYSFDLATLSSATWTTIPTYPFTLTGIPISTQGSNTVYIQLWDGVPDGEFSSLTSPISDSIIVDSVAPVVSSFVINDDDISTTSTAVTLTQSVSDATTGVKYMQFMNTARLGRMKDRNV